MNCFKYIVLSGFLLLSASCEKAESATDSLPQVAVIKGISELNQKEEAADSHKGFELRSVLEPVAEYQFSLGQSVLGIKNPVYPRIKKCADGSYLLLYQNGQIGSTIYCCTSYDLLSWEGPVKLFEPYYITTPDGDDTRRYSSADAVVLSNGDVLAVVSFRANKGYRYWPEHNGIAIKRSKDNGKTWSEEQVIYQGTTWEPYILELPNGRLHCYFTDTDPVLKNSGTSLVWSDDKGQTWSPTGLQQRERVIRQYKYMNQGERIYTDQMPCIRMLNDGHTLLGFMEARLEEGNTVNGASTYKMSLVYGEKDWKVLSGDEVGPQDRQSNLFAGAGGYVSQFHSGEVLLSCNINTVFCLKMGTCDGRTFAGESWTSGWYKPFSSTGFWGSTEVISPHEVLATIHNSDAGTIHLGKFYLNHKIDAPRYEIKADGNGNEWTSDQALFLGSATKEASAAIRAANDGSHLHILVERSDKYLNTGDDMAIYLTGGGSDNLKGAVRIDYSPAGEFKYSTYDGTWQETGISGVKAADTVIGTLSDGRSDKGYIIEISIPLSAIPNIADNVILINAVMVDGEYNDTFTGVTVHSLEKWLPILLLD